MLAQAMLAAADGVVARLKSATVPTQLGKSCDVARLYVPDFERGDLDRPRLTVAISDSETQQQTRASEQTQFTIQVALHVRVGSDQSNPKLDPWLILLGQIRERLRGFVPADGVDYLRSGIPTPYSLDFLKETNIFVGVVSVVYWYADPELE